MKKIIILIIAIFVSYTASQAGTENTIRSTIKKQISMPAQFKNQKLNEVACVQFKLENGKAIVLDVKTSNPELKDHIIKQFKAMSFVNVQEKQGMVYLVDINFKVL